MLFGRILELARHKTSKTVWETTPWWVAHTWKLFSFLTKLSRSIMALNVWINLKNVKYLFLFQLSNHMRFYVCSLIQREIDSKNPGANVVCVSFFEGNFFKLPNWRQMSGTFWMCFKGGETMMKSMEVIADWNHNVFIWKLSTLEVIFTASVPYFCHFGNFPPCYRSVRNWAGATRSQYGPSLLQHSELLQVQEFNTWPGTKETSQQGRTSRGKCSPSAPPTLLMMPSKRHEREGRLCCALKELTKLFFMMCCTNIFVWK